MKFTGNFCGYALISFKLDLQKGNEKENWFNNFLQNSNFDIINIATGEKVRFDKKVRPSSKKS